MVILCRFKINLNLTVILILCILFPMVGTAYAAGHNDFTINTSYSYTLTDSGKYNSSSEYQEIQLYNIFPQLTNDTAITYIRFRIKFNGSDARSDRNPYLDVQLADKYITYNGLFGAPTSPYLMARRYRSDSPAGHWFEYNYSFNPNNGDQVANRMVYLLIAGYESYDYCSWSFELLELRYRKYWIDYTLTITPERYVKITMNRPVAGTDTRVSVYNCNDGRWILGGSGSLNQFPGSNTEYVVTDSGVKPEVTYTYQINYKIGSSTNIPSLGLNGTVKVPSDATYAWDNTTYMMDNVLSANAGVIQDANGTVLTEARAAKATAENVSTKVDNIENAVTNISNSIGADTSPPAVKIKTVSGAMATSGSSIQAVLEVSDNRSSIFAYSLDGTAYQPLAPDGVISLPVNSPGPNIIAVWVKDEAGNTGRASITIRKL